MVQGVSQEELGRHLGLTFQQIQKYEKGANRISASKLYLIATYLDVPVQFFFDELPEGNVSDDDAEASAKADTVMAFVSNPEGLQLNRAYTKIGDPAVRRSVFNLVRSLGTDKVFDDD